jgi:hypothetical protein
MSRPTPPRAPMTMPEVKPKPLCHANRNRFAWILGSDPLPDACVHLIVWIIAAHQASRRFVKGHTVARGAAALHCVENRMRRGHDNPEATREITNPLFGADVETFTRLEPIINDPETPLEVKIDAIGARRRELEALPEVDARHGLRTVLIEHALVIWWAYAVDRNDGHRQWLFVREILEAAGELPPGVRKNPQRLEPLRHEVEGLLRLTAKPTGLA